MYIVLPLLAPSGPRRIVHSSIVPNGVNSCFTSSSVCCLLSIPTKSFRSVYDNVVGCVWSFHDESHSERQRVCLYDCVFLWVCVQGERQSNKQQVERTSQRNWRRWQNRLYHSQFDTFIVIVSPSFLQLPSSSSLFIIDVVVVGTSGKLFVCVCGPASFGRFVHSFAKVNRVCFMYSCSHSNQHHYFAILFQFWLDQRWRQSMWAEEKHEYGRKKQHWIEHRRHDQFPFCISIYRHYLQAMNEHK